ncbi:MAG: hypothetical protein LBL80_04960 [Ruminococcus sp.]|jgi:hypothetical protein|nr:hypothetical protein [Ruminococcus sp.]
MENKFVSDQEAEKVVGGFGFNAPDFGVSKKFMLCKKCGKTVEVPDGPGVKTCSNCGAEIV